MGDIDYTTDLSSCMSNTKDRLDSAEQQDRGLPGILMVTPKHITEAHTGLTYSRMLTRHVTYMPISTVGKFTLTLKTHIIFQGTGYSAKSEFMSQGRHERLMQNSSFHPKEQEKFIQECYKLMDEMENALMHCEDLS